MRKCLQPPLFLLPEGTTRRQQPTLEGFHRLQDWLACIHRRLGVTGPHWEQADMCSHPRLGSWATDRAQGGLECFHSYWTTSRASVALETDSRDASWMVWTRLLLALFTMPHQTQQRTRLGSKQCERCFGFCQNATIRLSPPTLWDLLLL